MRPIASLLTFACAVLASCGDPGDPVKMVSPELANANRTLMISSCSAQMDLNPACMVLDTLLFDGASSVRIWVYEGSVILRRDRTVQWHLVGRLNQQTIKPVLGSTSSDILVEESEGTYVIKGDSVFVHLFVPPAGRFLNLRRSDDIVMVSPTPLPSQVATTWPGPDELQYRPIVGGAFRIYR